MSLLHTYNQMRALELQARMDFATHLSNALRSVNQDSKMNYINPEYITDPGPKIKIANYDNNPDLNLYMHVYDSWISISTGSYLTNEYFVRDQNGMYASYSPPKKGVRYELGTYSRRKKGRDFSLHPRPNQDTDYIRVAEELSKIMKSLVKAYKKNKTREEKARTDTIALINRYNTQNGFNTDTPKS